MPALHSKSETSGVTILFGDYYTAAAHGHLVSDRMRLWEKKKREWECVFSPSLSVSSPPPLPLPSSYGRCLTSEQHNATTENHVLLLLLLLDRERLRTSCGLIQRTPHWNHELGVRAMGESNIGAHSHDNTALVFPLHCTALVTVLERRCSIQNVNDGVAVRSRTSTVLRFKRTCARWEIRTIERQWLLCLFSFFFFFLRLFSG